MGGDACVALGGKGARKVAFSPIERTMGGDACVALGAVKRDTIITTISNE